MWLGEERVAQHTWVQDELPTICTHSPANLECQCVMYVCLSSFVLCSGKLSRGKTFEGENFRELVKIRENFHRLLGYTVPKDASPPNFMKKTFVNSHKTAKFTKVFSLKSFPLYVHAPTYSTTAPYLHSC